MVTSLKVFRDLPGVAELERRAILDPALRSPMAVAEVPEIDEALEALFGDTADDLIGPDEMHSLSEKFDLSPAGIVQSFADRGWDVSDGFGRPAYMLDHFVWFLAAHIEGLIPLKAQQSDGAWGAAMEQAAKRFKPSR